jgi:hypothetical protein
MRLAPYLLVLALAACADDSSTGDGDGAPVILLERSTLAFDAVAAGPLPAGRTVRVDNIGGGNLVGLSEQVTYAPSQPAGWLQVALSSDGAPSLLSVDVTTTALAAGIYQATILVASSLAGVESRTITVTYAVAPTPALELVPASVSFSAPPGSGALSQLVEVRNGGGGNAEGLQATLEYGAGQPGNWLTIFLGATTTPTGIFLTARTGALAPGTYTATVRVTSSNAANSPASFIVTLTVT